MRDVRRRTLTRHSGAVRNVPAVCALIGLLLSVTMLASGA